MRGRTSGAQTGPGYSVRRYNSQRGRLKCLMLHPRAQGAPAVRPRTALAPALDPYFAVHGLSRRAWRIGFSSRCVGRKSTIMNITMAIRILATSNHGWPMLP